MAAGWKDLLRQVAPTLATALGGPLAGGVVRKLGELLLGNPDAGEDKVAAEVLKADPAMFLKLKELETEYAKFVLDHEINLEKLAVEDRGSARAREVSLKDWVPAFLAIGFNVAFFAILFLMLAKKIPLENKDAFTLLLGMLSSGVTGVLSYYFGSSRGSDRKTELMSGPK